MTAAASTLGLGAGAYLSSNLDNLLVLVALLAMPGLSRGAVLAGHLTGVLVVALGVSSLVLIPEVVPAERLGLLGLVPVFLGLGRLYTLARGAGMAMPEIASSRGRRGFSQALTLHVAGSADTLAVFGPLFVDSIDSARLMLLISFVTAAATLALSALVLARGAGRIALLSRAGAWATPVVMIAVGCYVLADTADDLMP